MYDLIIVSGLLFYILAECILGLNIPVEDKPKPKKKIHKRRKVYIHDDCLHRTSRETSI